MWIPFFVTFYSATIGALADRTSGDAKLCTGSDLFTRPCSCQQQQVDCQSRDFQVKPA
jgi:hypothetical protein